MKKFAFMMVAVSALAATAVPALAAPWQSINQRQAALDARIDQGVRNGALTRPEAIQLRAEFRQIANMEARYRATNGLQPWEISDLDRRFDALSIRIRVQKTDNDQRWQSINQRQANLDSRIDQGVRNGALTRPEAVRLRSEFRYIANLEARYRASNGLQQWERADLDRRYDVLSAKIRIQKNDGQRQ